MTKLIQLLTRILSLFMLHVSCATNEEKVNENDLANSALKFIYEKDTISLKKIIDTNYCYVIYSKEGFWYKIHDISDRIKKCNNNLDSNRIEKSIKTDSHTIAISFTLCKNKLDNGEQFKIVFLFDRAKKKSTQIMLIEFEFSPAPLKDLVPVPN